MFFLGGGKTAKGRWAGFLLKWILNSDPEIEGLRRMVVKRKKFNHKEVNKMILGSEGKVVN